MKHLDEMKINYSVTYIIKCDNVHSYNSEIKQSMIPYIMMYFPEIKSCIF